MASKLTAEQLDALTVNFLIVRTKNHSLLNLKSLEDYIDQHLLPFTETLTKNDTCYAHLEYAGCGSIIHIGGWGKIEARFRETYPGLFCKGCPVDEFEKEIGPITKYTPVLLSCLHDSGKIQLNAMDTGVLANRCAEVGFDDEEKAKLNQLFEKTRMSEAEIKEYFLRIRPRLADLFDIWDDSPLSRFTLTTVGIAIAQANFRRKTGQKLDLSIWIK